MNNHKGGPFCLQSENKSISNSISLQGGSIKINNVSVSVIPECKKWCELQGFKASKYGPFKYDFKNSNGEDIGGFKFYFHYNHSGNDDGHGKFLENVTMIPEYIRISSGYNLVCNVTHSRPMNYGTLKDPIAAIIMYIDISVEGINNLICVGNSSVKICEQYGAVCISGDGLCKLICMSQFS
ncbi:MAG: hypothetical protein PUE01_14280 [Clostridiaceae bacterium]|nr:hypothetical protein [Clostridiaceae bacterium]